MTVHHVDADVTLHHGRSEEVLRTLPNASIDAVVTDPPYELGFMGKAWDASGIAYSVPLWSEVFRVLKPGGHVLAFGGTRTWHRLAAAIEDAGFEVRDSLAWLYGSGFPKSLDVSKAVDRLDAAERLERARTFQAWLRVHLTAQQVDALTGTNMGHHLTTHPTQPSVATAEIFDRLRPSLPPVPPEIEDLVAARTVESKAFASRQVVETRQRGRIAVAPGQGTDRPNVVVDVTAPATDEAKDWAGWGTALKPAFEPIVVARKPLAGTVAANVVAHGTGALNIDDCRIDTTEDLNGGAYAVVGGPSESASLHGGSGMNVPGKTAAADFVQPPGRWPANVLLDEHQAEALDRQTGTLTSGKMQPTQVSGGQRRAVYGADAAAGYTTMETYGDTGGASRFFYVSKAPTSERPRVGGVAHPTVKPVDLMRWLVRLVCRRDGTVLDLFAGSGTTIEACLLEGMKCVAIEREADYLPLIMARLSKPMAATLDFGGAS